MTEELHTTPSKRPDQENPTVKLWHNKIGQSAEWLRPNGEATSVRIGRAWGNEAHGGVPIEDDDGNPTLLSFAEARTELRFPDEEEANNL